MSKLNDALLAKINKLRSENGVVPLGIDEELNTYAGTRSAEAAAKWSHIRPDGTDGCDIIPDVKWRGENLSYVTFKTSDISDAMQLKAADIMFEKLKASKSHYDNLVFASYEKIGIATSVTKTAKGVRLTTAYMFSN